jgi:hypothetical protein
MGATAETHIVVRVLAVQDGSIEASEAEMRVHDKAQEFN